MIVASELVSRVKISDVWRALGGASLRRCRGCAFWRPKADSWSVAIDDAKGTWYDHRDDCGGGVLDLVQHVLHCTRQEALKWLADLAGVTLDDRAPTAVDRLRWARAQREAEELTAWRRREINTLISWRNAAWDVARDADVALRSERFAMDDPRLCDTIRARDGAERLGDKLADAAETLGDIDPAQMRELRTRVEAGRGKAAA